MSRSLSGRQSKSPAIQRARSVFEAVNADNIRVHKRAAWLIREINQQFQVEREPATIRCEARCTFSLALIDPSATFPDIVCRHDTASCT